MGQRLSAPNADTPAITDDASADTSVQRPDEVGLEEQLIQALLRVAMDSSDSSDDGSLVANEELDAVEAELAVTSPLLRPDRADQKYEEAVAEAVEACAEDTMGQTCWICFDDGSNEGLVRMCACRGGAGFAHVSCLARQAQVEVEQAEQRRDMSIMDKKWTLWHTCRQCEQQHHGVVACALGWACWKTYLGRPERSWARSNAISEVGYGLYAADHYEDALSVQEAELAMERRLGADEGTILGVQGNLANTYFALGRLEEALSMERDVYSGHLRLYGEDHIDTLIVAGNYAASLKDLERFEEAKSLLRRTMPMARRVLGESHKITLKMRWRYTMALREDDGATLDDLREAVTTLEDTERTARRVLGGAHQLTLDTEVDLRNARAALSASEDGILVFF